MILPNPHPNLLHQKNTVFLRKKDWFRDTITMEIRTSCLPASGLARVGARDAYTSKIGCNRVLHVVAYCMVGGGEPGARAI